VRHEHLGLFDTPAKRVEIRIGLICVGLLIAASLLILPVGNVPVRQVDAFLPIVNSIIFVGEIIIATLLFAQSAVFRSRALVVLASGFTFIALLLIPYVLTFPGVFAPYGLLGAGTNSAAWIMIFRRLSIPLMIIIYALLEQKDVRDPFVPESGSIPTVFALAGAVGLAAALSAVAIIGHDWLPPIFRDRTAGIISNLLIFNLTNILLIVAAIVTLSRKRLSVLDIWLLVALAGWLIQSLLNLPLQARFTIGWYSLQLIVLASHLFLLVALIAESNRLYARLALSTAAQNREQETRMMSMDAVAAAISHEVAQPLAAVMLNASAGLEWLTNKPADKTKAIGSIRDSIAAGRRTFDVMKSIRATFAGGTESASQVSLNDLVRETTSLMDRELAARRVSLQMDLADDIPPVWVNRVQIQRVLINLLTNAIESVAATRRGVRRIGVRSKAADAHSVLLEVTDSGQGITDETLARIFDPFFTTKSKGTGLGLSLSRTIIEEHGGHVWASRNDEAGATFHVQLPLGPSPRRHSAERLAP
jgi:signal transduction histidine kinase